MTKKGKASFNGQSNLTAKVDVLDEGIIRKVEALDKTGIQKPSQLTFVNLVPKKDIHGITELIDKSLAPFRDITAKEYKAETTGYQTVIYRSVTKQNTTLKTSLQINRQRPEQELSIPIDGDIDASKWAKMEQDLDVLNYFAYSNGLSTITADLKAIMRASPRYEKNIKPSQLKSFTQSLELAKSITVTQALAISELRHKEGVGKKPYNRDKSGKMITHDIKVLGGYFEYKTYNGRPVAIKALHAVKLLEEFRLSGMRAIASNKGLLRIIAEQSPAQYNLAKAILARFAGIQDNTMQHKPLKWDRTKLIKVAGYQELDKQNTTEASHALSKNLDKLVDYEVIKGWINDQTSKRAITPDCKVLIYPTEDIAESYIPKSETKRLVREAKIKDDSQDQARKKLNKYQDNNGKSDTAKQLGVDLSELDKIITHRQDLTDEQILIIRQLKVVGYR
jgi:hypothetical protein